MTVELRGLGNLFSKMGSLEGDMRRRAAAGIYALAQEIMTSSKKMVPVDQGILRASGYVDAPRDDGKRITVELGYGGAAAAYAVRQHEDLSLNHPGGGQAKFLELAVEAARPHAADVVAAHARKAFT